MRSILEKAFVALLNEEHDKAEELFHKFIVERARQIHETNRAGDDYVLDENWNDEITSEHYFTEDDLTDLEDGGDVDADSADDEADLGSDEDDLSDETDMDSDEQDGDMDQSDLSMDHEGGDEIEDDAERMDRLEDKLDQLVAEFEAKMDEIGGGEEGDLDDFGSEEGENEFDMGGEDDGFGGDVEDAGHVEDDMDGADEDEVPMEGAEETDECMDEEYDDINESIIDELEKITVTLTDGKGVGEGETFTQDRKSNLPQKKIDARQGGTPIKMKQDAHKGFERETAPTVADMKARRNNVKSDKTVLAQKVSKEGNKAAELNKLSSETGNMKSPIEGKGGRGPVEV